VAEAQRLVLDGGLDLLQQPGRAPDLLDELFLAPAAQFFFQFRLRLEILCDGVLAGRGDDDEPFEPRFRGLGGDVLDTGRVDDREQLFRYGLGGRQEPRAQAGGRNDGGSDACGLGGAVAGSDCGGLRHGQRL
jgi:hypothetical protein